MLFGWVFLVKVAVSQQNPNYSHDKYSYYTPDKYHFKNNQLQFNFNGDWSSFKKLEIISKQSQYQWYLHNDLGGDDLNVKEVWKMGVTGKGVFVAIVDTGLLHEHSDLKSNYVPETSYDFTVAEKGPPPKADTEMHGTNVAGVIASRKDGECGVGIAYNSKISDIRISFGTLRNSTAVAQALQYKNNINDIYSCSWGFTSDGKSQSPLPREISDALKIGAQVGRKGKGSIFVFAAGNSNMEDDFCSFSSEANSIYTITVGAIDHLNRYASYSATCSGVLVTSYSGIYKTGTIVTTSSVPTSDFPGASDPKCSKTFSETSASAAMVSGVLALLLEKYSTLSWRDVQHLLIKSAIPVQEDHYSWTRTYAHRKHSTHFGFGRVDAHKLLMAANLHKPVDPAKELHFSFNERIQVPLKKAVQSCFNTNNNILLEHVTVTLNIKHQARKGLKVALKSPNGVISPLVFPRANDDSSHGFKNLKVLTLKHWDEPLQGKWCLIATDSGTRTTGTITDWSINFYGVSSASILVITPNLHNSEIGIPDDFSYIFRPLAERLANSYQKLPRRKPIQHPKEVHKQSPDQPEKSQTYNHSIVMSYQPEAQKHSNTFAETFMETERGNLMLIVGVASLASFVLASFFVIRHCSGKSSHYRQI